MSYIYSAHGDELDKLTILPGPDVHGVWVQINHGDTGWVTTIKAEDVPTVALAPLETAEFGRTVSGWEPVDFAVSHLREHRDKQAALKSEDSKVKAFRDDIMGALVSVHGESNRDSAWESLTELGREGWRARYRAARKHFEERA